VTEDVRRPETIEQALVDCREAMRDPNVSVVPTNALMVDMLTILVRLKHS
jgi:hypothetical protein